MKRRRKKEKEIEREPALVINFRNAFHQRTATAFARKDENEKYFLSETQFSRLKKKLCPVNRCDCNTDKIYSIPRDGLRFIIIDYGDGRAEVLRERNMNEMTLQQAV